MWLCSGVHGVTAGPGDFDYQDNTIIFMVPQKKDSWDTHRTDRIKRQDSKLRDITIARKASIA